MSETTCEGPFLVPLGEVSTARPHGPACWDRGAVTRSCDENGIVRDDAGQMRPKKSSGCIAGPTGPRLSTEASG
ncbi:hypothetical protein DCW30_34415 [Streptomyces alfalfae]|uniref:Uncharacterized protein n=1 Tax=Streptomyces alfalfae TaxID=1642299 RepID=A0ABM6GV92_9ACTN|nr:hypothetical protein A7J05_20455 [Streptomyces alfalfae]RXX35304.1 hypothetical protein DCW30_34415 [Streptomyces alfalfae]RZM83842.1 hypothetical protein D4104_32945 [Streptomyces alfalfae]